MPATAGGCIWPGRAQASSIGHWPSSSERPSPSDDRVPPRRRSGSHRTRRPAGAGSAGAPSMVQRHGGGGVPGISRQDAGDALREPSGGSRWFAEGRLDPSLLALRCLDDEALLAQPIDLLFSAVSKEVALQWEPRFADRVPVISTASAFRNEPDVPILIPGINDAHAEALHDQRRQRGWHGFIAPIPNCTTTGLAVSLKPLHDAFGVRTVVMTSLQAVSGAGRQGGVLALDVIDNVIPFIPDEEEKVERETKKILGHWQEPAPFTVSCTCTRVNVKDGHLESVFVGTERPVDAAAASAAMERFGVDGLKGLPSGR